jgi:hypothetical protein
MKKILLGATALTIAGVAGAASAQQVTTSPFNVDIGGFATLGIGYVDSKWNDEDNVGGAGGQADGNPFTVVDNAEVHLNFSLVADNGLTFGYKMEVEANGQGNNMDEYVGSVRGSFGTLEIGAEDGAADRLTGFHASYVFTSAADQTGLLFDVANDGVAFADTDGADTGDGLKITYFTPTIAGFEAGISYAATDQEGGVSSQISGVANGSDSGSGLEVGARYRNTFGAISVNIGGGYTYFLSDDTDFNAVTNPNPNAEGGYTLGAVIGFAGFEVSGIYGEDLFDGGSDRSSFGLGASYETGPWLFGVSYGQNLDNPIAEADDAFGIGGEVVYSLAPGVRTGLALEYASDTIDRADAAVIGTPGVTVSTDSAFAAGLFLGLTF